MNEQYVYVSVDFAPDLQEGALAGADVPLHAQRQLWLLLPRAAGPGDLLLLLLMLLLPLLLLLERRCGGAVRRLVNGC